MDSEEGKSRALEHITTGFWVAIGGFLFSMVLKGSQKIMGRD